MKSISTLLLDDKYKAMNLNEMIAFTILYYMQVVGNIRINRDSEINYSRKTKKKISTHFLLL